MFFRLSFTIIARLGNEAACLQIRDEDSRPYIHWHGAFVYGFIFIHSFYLHS